MARITRLLLITACSLLAFGCGMAALVHPPATILVVAAHLFGKARKFLPGTSHGSSAACTTAELQWAGMLGGGNDPQSLVMGRASYCDPPSRMQALRALFSLRVSSATACELMASVWRKSHDGLIRVKRFTHLLTIAPAGAGKSRSMIVGNLLAYDNSCVIVDPKGELWKKTAGHRQRVLGRKCIRLDPFGVAGKAESSHCLNPLSFITPDMPDFAEQILGLADSIVVMDDQQQPHFNQKAAECIAAFMAWICAAEPKPENRHIANAADHMGDDEGFRTGLKEMQGIKEFGGVVATMGRRLTHIKDKELGSVLSTAFRHLSWLNSPPVVASLSRSTFDPQELWDGKTDIYLCIPHDSLEELSGLLRLWLACIIKRIGRKGDESRPVLFIVDEAGHLGRQKAVERGISLMRSYGIRMWLFFQSLEQITECYGPGAKTIIDNCSHQQFFGLSSLDTAKIVSERIGDATVLVASVNKNAGRSRPTGQPGREPTPGSESTGWGDNISPTGRKLFFPSEILTLPRDCMLMFSANLPVIAVKLIDYGYDRAFRNGRSGTDSGPGVAGFLLAGCTLMLACFFAAFALMLPGIVNQPPAAPRQPDAWAMPAVPPPAGGGGLQRGPLGSYGGMGPPDIDPTPRFDPRPKPLGDLPALDVPGRATFRRTQRR